MQKRAAFILIFFVVVAVISISLAAAQGGHVMSLMPGPQ